MPAAGTPRFTPGVRPKMMRIVATVLVVLVLSASCATQSVRPSTDALSYLGTIAFPDADFEKVAMSDLIEYIADDTRCVCHPAFHVSQTIDGHNVTYVLRYCPHDAHDPESPDCILTTTGYPSRITRLGPGITIKTGRIKLDDLLRRVVLQAAGSLEATADAIVIRTKKVEPPGPPDSEGAADAFF